MGSTTYPAASSGGGGAPFAKAGTLVSSGTFGEKGFFLSETLPAGNYIITTDVKNSPDTAEVHISVNAPNSNVWIPNEDASQESTIRVTLTESDKIAVGSQWQKYGTYFEADNSAAIGIDSLGSSWTSRSYYPARFLNTDKFFVWWGDNNNSSGNYITYHNFADFPNFDSNYKEHGIANTTDATLGYQRALTSGGVVGNYAYFAFTNSGRLWRANLNTPTTWTVGTYAAATTGMITAIAYDGTTYVLVTGDGHINTSPDFSTWTKQTSPATSGLRDVIYAGGQFVAVGKDGNILTSSNGFSWTKRTAPAGITHLYNINYLNGTYFAFGGSSYNNYERWYYGRLNGGMHVKSTDGITWTEFDLQPTKNGRNNTNALRYGSYQPVERTDFDSDGTRDYGKTGAYVHNGWLYVDIVNARKFVTQDGVNWYCLYRFWDNKYIHTSPTHGQMNIYMGNYVSERPTLYINKPGNQRVYIYAETD